MDTDNNNNHFKKPEEKSTEQPVEKIDPDIEVNRVVALLSYFFILCLVPLLTKKDSPFAYFHAKQGLVVCIGWFFTWVPGVGTILGIFLGVLSVIGIINVMNGKQDKLPIIGVLADKLNI
jgi:uncharacterized membrane protein